MLRIKTNPAPHLPLQHQYTHQGISAHTSYPPVIPEAQSIKRNQQTIIRSDRLISPHPPRKINLRLRQQPLLIRQRMLINHRPIARRIQHPRRSRQFPAQILARRIFRIEQRVRGRIRVDIFREAERRGRSLARNSARTNLGGAIASDFQADVAVGGTVYHVEFDPGGGQEGAALDVADKAYGKSDG